MTPKILDITKIRTINDLNTLDLSKYTCYEHPSWIRYINKQEGSDDLSRICKLSTGVRSRLRLRLSMGELFFVEKIKKKKVMKLPKIEETVSYKTNDGEMFTKKSDALKHNTWLMKRKQLGELVQKVTGFWENNNTILSSAISDETSINNFEDYTKLIIILMKKHYLNKIVKKLPK